MQSLALVLASSLALTARAVPAPQAAAPPGGGGAAPAAPKFNITTVAAPTAARVIPVVVGGTALTFTPNMITANPGDIIQFQFNARNHTVTQSGETTPCQPLQSAMMPNAIHSGFIPFIQSTNQVGTFNMPVGSTEPMFLYCATGPHCQLGMVMTINANADQLTKYAALAATQKTNVPAANVAGGSVANIPLANAAFGSPIAAPAPPGVAPPVATPAAPAAPTSPTPKPAAANKAAAPNPPARGPAAAAVAVAAAPGMAPPPPPVK